MKLIKENFLATNWPYWVGGVFLGILNILFLLLSNRPLGVISMFYFLGVSGLEILYSISGITEGALSEFNSYIYLITVVNLGVIFGSFFSVFKAKQFRLKASYKFKRILSALSGGVLMGYGASIAGGCNIGAMFGGIASFSLHGWVFTIFMLFGVYLGGKLIKLIIS